MDNEGCIAGDTIKVSYSSLPVFSLGPDQEICDGQIIGLNADISDANYLWDNGSVSRIRNITTPGMYYVEASNRCGIYSDTIKIVRGICQFALPNAFTPNNDGKNDELKMANTSFIQNYRLVIFNRWGQQIFVTTDPNKGWNGEFSGKPQPEGNYLYTVSLTDNNGKAISTRGSVLLIR